MHRLVSAHIEVLHERDRHLEQAPLDRCPHAQFEEVAAEPVVGATPVQQPHSRHVGKDSVQGSFGNRRASRQLGQRKSGVVDGEGV